MRKAQYTMFRSIEQGTASLFHELTELTIMATDITEEGFLPDK